MAVNGVRSDIFSKTYAAIFVVIIVITFVWQMVFPQILYAGIETVACCDSRGNCGYKIGSSWNDTYNGTQYICTCASGGGSCKPKSSSTRTGTNKTSKNYNFNQDIKMMVVEEVMGALLNDLFAVPNDSANEQLQEQLKLQQEQARIAEEQAKKAALDRWHQMQSEAEAKNKLDQQNNVNQGTQALTKIKSIGSVNSIEPFRNGNATLDLKPISQNTYPASKDIFDQLMCSAYFSNLAKKASDPEDMRFYADQAQRVMSGEPTYLECKIPQVSAKRKDDIKNAYEQMGEIELKIQDIDVKLAETKEKIKAAETKKEQTVATIIELQDRAATATPEEKPEIDTLLLELIKLEKQIDQGIQEAKQEDLDYQKQKEEAEAEFNNMKTQLTAKE